jgi:hypothetical protein
LAVILSLQIKNQEMTLFFLVLAPLKTALASLDSLQEVIFEFPFGRAPSEEPQEARAGALPNGAKKF